jgi:aryl-alcohol dehydrogenase-like predicted oxidoreductase
MVKRGLGSSGIEVGPIAFGCNVFGWTADEAMSFRLLDAFTAAGSNLIDTADSYSKRVIGASNYSAERLSQEMEICEQRVCRATALFRPCTICTIAPIMKHTCNRSV